MRDVRSYSAQSLALTAVEQVMRPVNTGMCQSDTTLAALLAVTAMIRTRRICGEESKLDEIIVSVMAQLAQRILDGPMSYDDIDDRVREKAHDALLGLKMICEDLEEGVR